MHQPDSSWRRLIALLVAVAMGAAALWLSDFVQAPMPVPSPGHGETFARMSAEPLAMVGGFPQRILAPLLAHVTGLGGPRYPLFAQVGNALLLAIVFWCSRRRGAAPVDAALITVAIACTGAVQVYKLLVGLSDTFNLLLLLVAVQFAHRAVVFWICVLLSALSHEMVFFLAPWLLYHRHRCGGVWWREGLALAAIAGLYKLWRMFVASRAAEQAFDASYYASNNFFPSGTLWLWGSLALMWLVLYGPLLAVVVWAWRNGELGFGRLGPWLFAAGMLTMLVFAYDVARFANFVYVPLVLASVRFLAVPGTRVPFALLLAATIGIYRWQHPPPGIAGGVTMKQNSDLLLETGAILDHSRLWTEVIPRAWPAMIAVAVASTAVIALGLWLARRIRPVAAATGTCSSSSPGSRPAS